MSTIFRHPIKGEPYALIEFVRHDGNGTPLYRVKGLGEPECGAFEALGKAFRLKGGRCFYCDKRFAAQALGPDTAHRDHVLPLSDGGTDNLHNLVIACNGCGHAKRSDDIFDFRPRAAKRYQRALIQYVDQMLKPPVSG
jgi:hypothetical protein